MKVSLFIIVAVVGAACAANTYTKPPYTGPSSGQPSYKQDTYKNANYKNDYAYPPTEYNYQYDVYEPYPDQYNNGYDNSYGNNYPLKLGAEESRKDDYTKGSYYVLRPDGVLQTVDYYVNGYSGFVANVNEEPQNVHYNNNDYNKNAPYSDKKY